jgi:hypothetical protein
MKRVSLQGVLTFANVYLFQTPVPNYTDVDLSFSYQHFHSSFDFATLHDITPYQFVEQMIPFTTEMMEKQLSSPQLQEFIRSAHLIYLDYAASQLSPKKALLRFTYFS